MRVMTVLMLLAAGLVILGSAGCGGGGGVPPVAPPTVTAAAVTPTELRFTGGTVDLTATVQSAGPIQAVAAAVTGPAGPQNVALALAGGQYVGTFAAPANQGDTGVPYTVSVTARDTGGRTSAPRNAGTFTVQPADDLPGPPAPPPGW